MTLTKSYQPALHACAVLVACAAAVAFYGARRLADDVAPRRDDCRTMLMEVEMRARQAYGEHLHARLRSAGGSSAKMGAPAVDAWRQLRERDLPAAAAAIQAACRSEQAAGPVAAVMLRDLLIAGFDAAERDSATVQARIAPAATGAHDAVGAAGPPAKAAKTHQKIKANGRNTG